MVELEPGEAKSIYERRRTLVESYSTLVQRSIDRHQKGAQEKDLSIDVRLADDIRPIIADTEYLADAISRLVDNAIKFSPCGAGSIVLGVDRAEDMVRVSIIDQGIGIRQWSGNRQGYCHASQGRNQGRKRTRQGWRFHHLATSGEEETWHLSCWLESMRLHLSSTQAHTGRVGAFPSLDPPASVVSVERQCLVMGPSVFGVYSTWRLIVHGASPHTNRDWRITQDGIVD